MSQYSPAVRFVRDVAAAFKEEKRAKAARADELDAMRDLANYLEESHHEELQNRHYGERKADCSYCKAIKRARRILVAAERPRAT